MDSEIVHRSRTPSIHRDDEKYMWNQTHEQTAVNWSEMVQYYSVMHRKAGEYYDTLHQRFGLPIIVLSGVVGTVEFASLAQDGCDRTWVNIFAGFLSLLGVIFGVMYNQLKYDERSLRHTRASNEYESLHYFILEQLSYYRTDRLNVRAFFRSVRERLKILKKIAPDVPFTIRDKYIRDLDKALIPIKPTVAQEPGSHLQRPAEEQQESKRNVRDVKIDVNSNDPDDLFEDETSIQDEFATMMKKKLDERRQQIENYHIRRLETNLNTLESLQKTPQDDSQNKIF